MMNFLKLFSIAYYVGMVLVLIGTIAALTKWEYAGIILAAGALPIVGVRFYNRLVSTPERQRINGILLVSSLILACGVIAYIMEQQFWIVCMFSAAILDGYSSFRRLT